MATTLRMSVPDDYVLARDCCSYGYFLLAPNHWDVKSRRLTRVLTVRVGVRRRVGVRVVIGQKGEAGGALSVRVEEGDWAQEGSAARRAVIEQIRAQVTRMLRLDESAAVIAAFHARDPRWRESGRGRLFRSPTVFEDVIKTVTSCNVQWPGTMTMNRRLCEVVGPRVDGEGSVAKDARGDVRGFPDAAGLGRVRAGTLRSRCRVGYRDARIVALSRLFGANRAHGGVEVARLEDAATPDAEVWDTLLGLPGIGPYAAANVMQLLGRYGRLPLDTESVRHGRVVLGYTGTPKQVMTRLHEHYVPFGPDAFRSYWLELWSFYESKFGPAWTWERDTTGRVFTAATLGKA